MAAIRKLENGIEVGAWTITSKKGSILNTEEMEKCVFSNFISIHFFRFNISFLFFFIFSFVLLLTKK